MKCFLLVLLPISAMLLSAPIDSYSKLISNKIIWEGEPYASFTSLEYYQGAFYCAFREGNSHYDVNGKDNGNITIIKSNDGDKWEKFFFFSEQGYDLRDPKLSVTPDEKLMLLVEKVKYVEGVAKERSSCVSLIDKKGNTTMLQPIKVTPDMPWNWLWDITWIDGVAYGFTYAPFYGFVKSIDGVNYELLEIPDLKDCPTETSIAQFNKSYIAVTRRDHNAAIGIYNKDKKQWKWKSMDFELSCPIITLADDGNIYVAGRTYNMQKNLVSLYSYNTKSDVFYKLTDLADGVDCGYPGLVYYKGYLFMSYYKGNGKSSSLYFAKIKVN